MGALVTLIIGWIIAGRFKALVHRALGRSPRFDPTLISLFGSLARYVVIAVTIVAVLNQVGVETASLLAVLGAVGLVIGLALQGTLSNVAAGVMLLIFRPFKIGDYVEAGGIAGGISANNLFVTELTTPDNVQITAPNGQLWGTAVKDYTLHPTRRIERVVGIAYEDDIDSAIAAAGAVIEAEPNALRDPQPSIVVGELADSSVNLIIRAWSNRADYWSTRCALIWAIKERFDQDGTSIPFPQRTVHMVQLGAGA